MIFIVESDDEGEQSSSDEPPSSDHQPHTELWYFELQYIFTILVYNCIENND